MTICPSVCLLGVATTCHVVFVSNLMLRSFYAVTIDMVEIMTSPHLIAVTDETCGLLKTKRMNQRKRIVCYATERFHEPYRKYQ